MARGPLLKQFGELTPDDFVQAPIWANVHCLDYDKPWYEGTDEETFRPWDGPRPVPHGGVIFLVRATLRLADGSLHGGFVTPHKRSKTVDLGTLQPYLFGPRRKLLPFWDGVIRRPESETRRFYKAVRRTAAQVFPVTFELQPGLAQGLQAGVIPGFAFLADRKTAQLYR